MSSDSTALQPSQPQEEQQTSAPLAPSTNTGRPLTGRGVAHHTTDDLWRTAQMLVKTGMVPKAYAGKPELAYAAIVTGAELGYSPAAALRCIAVVNGTPSVWGTGGYALPMQHELYRGHDITYQMPGEEETDTEPELPIELDKIPDGFRVICRAYRSDTSKPITAKFSVADAKRAGLWGRTSRTGEAMTWSLYPTRMMMHKAVGNALEAAFPDSYFNIGKDLDQEAPAPQDEEPKKTDLTPGTTRLKPPKERKPVAQPKATEPESPKPNEGEVIDVTPEPEPEPTPEPQPEPEKPAKVEKLSTKEIMKRFSDENPTHPDVKMTKDKQGIQWIKCDCGSVWRVDIGLVDNTEEVTFPVNQLNPHNTTPPEPAKPKLTVSEEEEAERQQIMQLETDDLNKFFEEKLRQLAKANLTDRRKGVKPIAWMIRRKMELATTLIHISQASQWINRALFVLSMDGELHGKIKAELESAQARIKAA